MSAADLKKIVDESTPKERQFLRAYLAEAYPEDDTFDPAELDRRARDMQVGKKVSWDDAVQALDNRES